MNSQGRIRVHFSINRNVAELFARVAPQRKMSSIVETLIAEWCNENMEKLREEEEREVEKLRNKVVSHGASS